MNTDSAQIDKTSRRPEGINFWVAANRIPGWYKKNKEEKGNRNSQILKYDVHTTKDQHQDT
jgi:hypothetical protein